MGLKLVCYPPGQSGEIASYPVLMMIVMMPYLLYAFRQRPMIVVLSLIIYTAVVIPLAVRGQLHISPLTLSTFASKLVALGIMIRYR